MALLTAAIGAGGAAAALSALGHLAGRSRGWREAQLVMSSNACAKVLGAAMCRPAGSWRKSSRHVTLIGELLVISRRPDSAESWLQLRGTDVTWDGCTVEVISPSGTTWSTFWLSSPAEAARWAKELHSAAASLSKMASLNARQMQMDTISSVQDLWEARIAMAQDSGAQLDGLPDEAAEEEQEEPEVDSDSFKGSGVLSFKEVQALWEARIATGRDSGAQTDGPLDAAAEEEQAESEVGSFKGSEVDSLKETSEAGTPTSTRCPSEDSAVGSLGDLPRLDLPGALDLGRLKIEGLGETFQGRGGQLAEPQGQPGAVQTTPRTLRIFELEERLAQATELPKQLSLSRRRAHDLVRQTADQEAELARLRQKLLLRRAQDMLRPRIISSTSTIVHQGPAVVKGVVSRPFSTVQGDQTDQTCLGLPSPRRSPRWSPRATLAACPEDSMMAVYDA